MKKRNLTSLKLNKKTISNPKATMTVKGGGTHYESICDCPDTLYTIKTDK
ncbi:hypothetical protein C8N46_101484 [Kordia periserrulae]|uniref:Uncharacterized protein n=1 Tax=Kordia periserrulae TaxID=701523 RepID=A0A2T6C6F3_9FLAO|nr:hypothetical protein [Kordia periserrulae]PTX63875.1 hypothetical protein C8N46_101484 [Kordia periserrulae]